MQCKHFFFPHIEVLYNPSEELEIAERLARFFRLVLKELEQFTPYESAFGAVKEKARTLDGFVGVLAGCLSAVCMNTLHRRQE